MLRPPLEYYIRVCFIKVQAAKGSEKDIKVDQRSRKLGFSEKKLTNLVFPSSEKRRGKQSLNRQNILIRERECFFCVLGARRNGLKLPKLPEVFDQTVRRTL